MKTKFLLFEDFFLLLHDPAALAIFKQYTIHTKKHLGGYSQHKAIINSN